MKGKIGIYGKKTISLILLFALLISIAAIMPQRALAAEEYAKPATEQELNDVALWFTTPNGAGSVGTYTKIINGVPYSWGSNVRGATGLTGNTITNAAGETYTLEYTGNATTEEKYNIAVPTPMPLSWFGGSKVVRLASAVSVVVALTEANEIYVWGHMGGGNSQAALTGSTYNARHVDTSLIHNAGYQIIDIRTCGHCSWLKCRNDAGQIKWYGFGHGGYQLTTTVSSTTAYPIRDEVVAAVGGEIRDIGGEWCYATYIIGAGGKLYGWGNTSNPRNNGLGVTVPFTNSDGTVSDNVNIPVKFSDSFECFKGVQFTSMCSEDWSVCLIDSNGNVWGIGRCDGFGNASASVIDASHKIFDVNKYQKKAVRAWITYSRLNILCEDNTIYSAGNNPNGVIDPAHPDVSVTTPIQVSKNISLNETIVGFYPSTQNHIIITKAGDMHFAGDNRYGGAGNGTTETAPPGETTPVVSTNMPPSAPVTANEIFFEIEAVNEDGATVFYSPTGTKNSSGRSLYDVYKGGKKVDTAPLSLDAGSTFKLNVYFNDFGKIQTFVVPVRFDPDVIKVVNGAGTVYSSSIPVVTPGTYGASVGIEQCFDTKDWAGGQLNAGTVTGTYPKISNAGGYVSVAGYSTESGSISGKVKMFSIAFRAQKDTNGAETGLEFATSNNIPDSVDTAVSPGYDNAISAENSENRTAYWGISNAGGKEGKSGYFEFKTNPFPRFATTFIQTTKIDLALTFGANKTMVQDTLGQNKDPDETDAVTAVINKGWRINWTNKDVTYTVTATSYGLNNKKASFQAVTWGYALYDKNGNLVAKAEGDTDDPYSKYISIVGTGENTVSFKVNSSFTPEKDDNGNVIEPPVYVQFTATSKSVSVSSQPSYVKLKNFAAPGHIQIAQSTDNGVTRPEIPDGTEIVFNYTKSKTKDHNFWVSYGVDKNGAYITSPDNGEVVWSLLDSDGDPIDQTVNEAVATMTLNTNGTATINPRFTLKNDDYLVLHVESLYDSSVYDEVRIKIQLYATELKFSQEIIRMSVMTETSASSVDLSKYLQITPADTYITNLTWTVTKTPTGEPGNANIPIKDSSGNATGTTKNTWAAGDVVNYGALGTGSTAAVFYAYQWATPTADKTVSHQEEFVEVSVTDSYSNESATVKIAIMDINSPIEMSQFEAKNNIGTVNDTVTVKSGLELNDIIRFYSDYSAAKADTDGSSAERSTTIVDPSMAGTFTFSVGGQTTTMMNNEGGYLYATLTRANSAGQVTTYDPVPVAYSSEPSLVYGYIHLYGKVNGSSQDAGVNIGLVGGTFKEYVTTDATGYFKFTKYIAPGNYTMTISKPNYLTRTATVTIETGDNGKFAIATQADPLLLFPGDLTSDDIININDIVYYVANWVGLTDDTITNYDLYDFQQDELINMADLELLLQRKDWTPSSYPAWSVPKQS